MATLIFPAFVKNEIPMGKLEVSNPVQAFLCMVETKERCTKIRIMDRSLKRLFSKILECRVRRMLLMVVSLTPVKSLLDVSSRMLMHC